MNLNVPEDFFNAEYQRLMSINDYNGFDEHVIDVITELKKAPFLHKICPRWSCQGHSYDNRDSEYEIIFVTQDNGPDILYEMFQYMKDELIKKQYGCALINFSVLHLIREGVDEKNAVPHIKLHCTSYGKVEFIFEFKNLWIQTIKEFSQRYN